MGLWLLAPWIDRTLGLGAQGSPRRSRPGVAPRVALAAAMLGVVAIAVTSIMRDPFDVVGRLPDPPVTAAAPQGGEDASDFAGAADAAADDWPAYGCAGQGQRYSSLQDITPETVHRMRLAWTFHTGESLRPGEPVERAFEVTPLKIGELLYLCSVRQNAIAQDAATGQVPSRFDPHIEVGHASQHLSCRGLAYFDGHDGASVAPASAPAGIQPTRCTRRIFLPTIDACLFALDARTGEWLRPPGMGLNVVLPSLFPA